VAIARIRRVQQGQQSGDQKGQQGQQGDSGGQDSQDQPGQPGQQGDSGGRDSSKISKENQIPRINKASKASQRVKRGGQTAAVKGKMPRAESPKLRTRPAPRVRRQRASDRRGSQPSQGTRKSLKLAKRHRKRVSPPNRNQQTATSQGRTRRLPRRKKPARSLAARMMPRRPPPRATRKALWASSRIRPDRAPSPASRTCSAARSLEPPPEASPIPRSRHPRARTNRLWNSNCAASRMIRVVCCGSALCSSICVARASYHDDVEPSFKS
jgi:hypothetical protein